MDEIRYIPIYKTKTMSDLDMKKIATECIDKLSGDLRNLSKEVWENPELAYKEYRAHDVLTQFLEKHGFKVTRKYKLETAFLAEFDCGENASPHVAVLCEYDALPGIGHACGHNLIAEVGVAAGIAVKAALEAKDVKIGKLSVIGTPAEEGMCGKADLIQMGVFDKIDAAMMAHPSQFTLTRTKYTSMVAVKIIFRGLAAHAASYPWEGLNALDAAVMCYNNISCLRQQMKPNWRVHGVIRRGGLQPNVTPDETELEYYLRTPTETELTVLREKVISCIQGAAIATGCQAGYTFQEKHYQSLNSNEVICRLFDENGAKLGIEFEQREEIKQKFGGSTDMGNVSHVVPSIHPKFYIGTTASNHSKEFTVAAGKEEAQGYTLAIAKALAMTALDIFTKPELLSEIKEEFKRTEQA